MRNQESRCRLQEVIHLEQKKRRPYVPERSRPSFEPQIAQEFEVPLIDILNEVGMVKQECRQLRTQVESVAPQPTEAAGGWEQSPAEITSRQDALATRVAGLRPTITHINTIAQDQN